MINQTETSPQKSKILKWAIGLVGGAMVLLLALALLWPQIHRGLFYITGEEELLKQISGGVQYLYTRLQPPLNTADMLPVQYAGVSPYGVNTFLQNEVEPAKREQALHLASEAGFKWIRQEFTWEDIEIHGKGDFEDRRHEPYQSAWNKYDNIVDLAEQNDIQIMARLSNPPAWTRALTNTVGTYAPPDDVQDYGDFVEAVARRYKGRIHVYQLWNEPNIYPEWGSYPINAAEYVALLKEGYSRIKAVDPEAIVVMGALAATIELARERNEGVNPGGLADTLFLQQVYDAGGGNYFDVLAMQGYGLWSGPYDRRMQARVLNFSRPLYIRDIMVRNGDAHKPIWLSEMAWNALPPEAGIPANYGMVSPQQQGDYAALAYQRMQEEWPWLGVGNYWFLKQATDQELKDGNPQYFFRLLEPDFTPLPAYNILKEYNNQPGVIYRGYHQEDHWAINYSPAWQADKVPNATFEKVMQAETAGATIDFPFKGTSLMLVALPGPKPAQVEVKIDDHAPQSITIPGGGEAPIEISLARSLKNETHTLRLTTLDDSAVQIDGFIVDNAPPWQNKVGSFIMVGVVLLGLVIVIGIKFR